MSTLFRSCIWICAGLLLSAKLPIEIAIEAYTLLWTLLTNVL